MTVFHYPMFYLLIWSNQILIVFCLFLSPNRLYLLPIISTFWEKASYFETFYPTNEKKHTIIAECQIVSIHRKSYLQRFLHTLPFGSKKDPEPFLVRDLSKSIFSFLPTNWDFLFSRRFTVFICTYITPGMSACHDDFATGVFICVHLHDLRI